MFKRFVNLYQGDGGGEVVLLKPKYENEFEVITVLSKTREFFNAAVIYAFADLKDQEAYNQIELAGYVDDETAERNTAFEEKLIAQIIKHHGFYVHDAGEKIELLAIEKKYA